jgi:hypothetical protein
MPPASAAARLQQAPYSQLQVNSIFLNFKAGYSFSKPFRTFPACWLHKSINDFIYTFQNV